MNRNAAIIFGDSGQDSFYMKQLLKSKNIKVYGFSRSGQTNCNIANYESVSQIIKKIQPKYIFQFAAVSNTSHEKIWDNFDAITKGSINVLESVRLYSQKTKVFIPGSALQLQNSGKAISESNPLINCDVYSMCRNQSLQTARYYKKLGLNVYYGFLFNHDSFLRSSNHLTQKIASFCRDIKSQTTKLKLGALDMKREWNYAGDVVEGIWTFVNQENSFEIIIGSGQAYSVEEWLKTCFNIIGEDWRNHVEVIPNFQAKNNVLYSNPSLLKSFGWQPKVSMNELASKMINNEQ